MDYTCAWSTYANNEDYLKYALVLYTCLTQSGTKYPFVLMVPSTLECDIKERPGLIVRRVEPFDVSSDAHAHDRYVVCANKAHCWALTDFLRVCWLDTDMVISANIDELFQVPLQADEIAAAKGCTCNHFNNPKLITNPSHCPFQTTSIYVNTGVILLTPSMTTYHNLLNISYEYPFADQDAFNDYFKGNIRVLDSRYNFLNHLPLVHDVNACSIKVYHFGYGKPWDFNLLGLGYEYYDLWKKMQSLS